MRENIEKLFPIINIFIEFEDMIIDIIAMYKNQKKQTPN